MSNEEANAIALKIYDNMLDAILDLEGYAWSESAKSTAKVAISYTSYTINEKEMILSEIEKI